MKISIVLVATTGEDVRVGLVCLKTHSSTTKWMTGGMVENADTGYRIADTG